MARERPSELSITSGVDEEISASTDCERCDSQGNDRTHSPRKLSLRGLHESGSSLGRDGRHLSRPLHNHRTPCTIAAA